MKRWWLVAAVGGLLGLGCGGKPLPAGDGGLQHPRGDGGGGGGGGGDGGDGSPDGGEVPPLGEGPLWPLTAGSTWTYRISDPNVTQPFEKTVRVLGEAAVPESAGVATVVLSEQPFLHYTEKSWQVLADGLVFRVREEDRRSNFLVRVTSWSPATVKSLNDVPQEPGWVYISDIHETVRLIADNTTEAKAKQYTWRVLSLNEEVTVPAGTFRAVKVHRERTADDKQGAGRTYWLVPGVGKVREEGERTEELLRFDVKK